jgi:dTDP-4-amino-4,6-dideoxygalactose transaminase
LAVHTHSVLADISLLLRVFPRSHVIEDAAHCPGARHQIYPDAGSQVLSTIVSFEATKPLTCLEGGAVSFQSVGKAKLARELLRRDIADYYNNRHPERDRPAISQLSCSLLLYQLDCYDEVCCRRAEGALYMTERLNDLSVTVQTEPAVIGRGSFYGILLLIGPSDPATFIDHLERQTGLVCDRHYLPYAEWKPK